MESGFAKAASQCMPIPVVDRGYPADHKSQSFEFLFANVVLGVRYFVAMTRAV